MRFRCHDQPGVLLIPLKQALCVVYEMRAKTIYLPENR